MMIKMNRAHLATGGFVLMLCGALSGCASGSEGASPAPSENAVQRDAASLSTKVCVRNEASEGPVRVTFSTKDTQWGTGEVVRGEAACAEGSFINVADIEGTIEHTTRDMGVRNTKDFIVRANNPWIGPPNAVVKDLMGFGVCKEFSVGQTVYFDDSVRRISITRMPDTNWKVFEVVVEDSRGESGKAPRLCRDVGMIGD